MYVHPCRSHVLRNVNSMQVLSKSVADCLDYYSEDGTAETQRFVRKFDRFFDMMNTRCLEEGYYNKKKN